MIVDTHIHTSFSLCSVLNIPTLLKKARKVGLDGVCITDHDTMASQAIFNNIDNNQGICVIIGMEYTTLKGDFLVFVPNESIPKGMSAEALIKWVNKEGGAIIPAHPFRKSRPTDLGILSSVKIVEVLNGRNQPSENESCKIWLSQYGNGTRLIGGSDAHTPEEIGRIVTVFKKNIYDVEDFINELHTGNYTPRQLRSF
jgi:predicted metal-dependent phosphoesterase TrpH